MSAHLTRFTSLLGLAAIATLAWFAVAIGAAVPAGAQVVAIVNGDPITALDITHRTRLTQLITQRSPGRKEVLDELVDERLKTQEAKRWNAVPTDAEVERSFAGMAARVRMTPDQFAQALAQQGSDARSYRSKLRADMAWGGLVRARFRAAANVGEREIERAITDRNKPQEATRNIEYSLRQIVFVVPRGSADSVVEQRRREAENLRSRFPGCEEGIALARQLREVVVRDPLRQNSADLTPALRDLFRDTPDGKLTAPERTAAGVEVVAVCGRKEIAGQSAAQNDLKQELVSERLQVEANRYIAQLRQRALIEYR